MTQSSQEDWHYAIATAYKNWGAIDGSNAKFDAIALKHYGSQEKQEAASAHRIQLRQAVAIKLLREFSPNPLP